MVDVDLGARRAILDPDGGATAQRAYVAWEAARSASPRELVEAVTRSGLRGRGGAGFPTGKKLELTLDTAGDEKYVVVNGAEDEPGSLKDRFLLEHVPAKVVEGAMISARAVGARGIVFYVSVELPVARAALERELDAAREHGLAFAGGGSPATTTANGELVAWLVDAPSAYVAGEDTAALEVIEGREGLPRPKPPYPVTEGLFGKPTLAMNAETAAAIPSILWRGAEWYRSLGTSESPGTMLFTLGEEMQNPGVYELELGIPLRELLERHGGGLRSGGAIKAVLPGGPSSGFLGSDQLDIPLDHASLRAAGSALGCGVVKVYEAPTCMVEALQEILAFFARECCGQCPPCRMETNMLVRVVEQVRSGAATQELFAQLPGILEFAKEKGGFCSLITMPAAPVKTALALFPEDFRSHLESGRCRDESPVSSPEAT